MKPETGFTLIEVLVATLVIGLGILGIAALNGKGQQIAHDAYEIQVATWQTNDLIEKIRANPGQAAAYGTTLAMTLSATGLEYGTNPVSVTDTTNNKTYEKKACVGSSASCTASQLAEYQMYSWIKETAEQLQGATVSITIASPNGSVSITTGKGNTIATSFDFST